MSEPACRHRNRQCRPDHGAGGTLAPTSPILGISAKLDPAIDMVVSGHTHQPYVCNVADPDGNQRLVTSASSFGRLYTATTLHDDRRTNDIVRASVRDGRAAVQAYLSYLAHHPKTAERIARNGEGAAPAAPPAQPPGT